MNWLDIVIIILLVVSIISGIISGFIKTLFSLVGLIIGVVLAGRFYVALAGRLSFISDENTAKIVAFIIIFAAVAIIAAILGVIFTKIVSAMSLGWINRLLGGIAGLFLGAISIAALLVILVKFTGLGDVVSGSALATFLIDKLPIVTGLLPSEFDTINQFFQ
jgi:membrane protein required for colicin V production